jgi:ABC-type glycerol-3-phosphate transport system substrate-binding protein
MALSRREILLSGVVFGMTGVAFGSAQAAEFAAWEAGLKGKPAREIRILAISHPASDAMKALTPEFEAATGIKVTWEVVGSGEIMSKQLLAQTARDTSYDVYMVRGTALAASEAKRMLADLGDLLKDKDATPDDYDFEDIHVAYRQGIGTAKGKTLGIPVAGETFFLSYRKDLFEKYGRKAPDTMDELLETARFFQNKEPGLYGISMRAETGRTLALSWEQFTPAFGANVIDQKTWDVAVDSPETQQSLEYLLALLSNAPPDIETYSWDAAVSAFASGKTAMWFDATSLQPWLTDTTKSKIVGKVGYVAPPSGPQGRVGPGGGGGRGRPPHHPHQEAGGAVIARM